MSALTRSTSSDMNPIDETIARISINTLLHRYSSVARENADHSETATLFEPGSVIIFPDGRERTPEQLGELTAGDGAPKRLRHHLTTIDVQFINANEAHCQSYNLASTDVKVIDHCGQWDHVVRRQADGKWLISKMIITLLGTDADGWLAGRMKVPSES